MDSFDLAQILPFIGVGFAAQVVDGALGMAFGVISNTLLISLGVAPAAASAGVHTVETFTTCVSGISHIAHRNVDWKLLARLALPGIVGAALGAYVLTQIDAATAKPIVLAYLTAIGLFLVWRGVRYPPHHKPPRIIAPLGLAGGFLDAAGGGGWGPVVTGNLLAQGAEPRKTIGTVNTSEVAARRVVGQAHPAQAAARAGRRAADDHQPLRRLSRAGLGGLGNPVRCRLLLSGGFGLENDLGVGVLLVVRSLVDRSRVGHVRAPPKRLELNRRRKAALLRPYKERGR